MVDLTQTELVEWRDLKSQRWGKALKAHILCFWKEEEEEKRINMCLGLVL